MHTLTVKINIGPINNDDDDDDNNNNNKLLISISIPHIGPSTITATSATCSSTHNPLFYSLPYQYRNNNGVVKRHSENESSGSHSRRNPVANQLGGAIA